MSLSFHHCSLTVSDTEKTRWFWLDLLGLSVHPKGNWFSLDGGQGYQIHVLPNDAPGSPASLSRHVAFQVVTLEALRDTLLAAGIEVFQSDLKGNVKAVNSKDDNLDFGIGTLFTRDPDGNTVEFVQQGRGLIGKINEGANAV